jgi:hypothetical protein
MPVVSPELPLKYLLAGIAYKTFIGVPENQSKYMLTDQHACPLLPLAFPSFYVSQGLIIKAEVVGYFMAHHFPYFRLNFVAGTALRLYRPLKDTYLIGQD